MMANPLDAMRGFDPARKAYSLFEEFKAFALKGNVIDLAVGVIVGGAFAVIVKSLVDNLFMPLITAVIPGDQSYKEWAWVINGQQVKYGQFLADVVNFVIVALVLFVFIVKFLGWVMRLKKDEAVAPPPPTRDQELLMEIRDLLKQQRA
jgi:large conductance mechanosensitive channel